MTTREKERAPHWSTRGRRCVWMRWMQRSPNLTCSMRPAGVGPCVGPPPDKRSLPLKSLLQIQSGADQLELRLLKPLQGDWQIPPPIAYMPFPPKTPLQTSFILALTILTSHHPSKRNALSWLELLAYRGRGQEQVILLCCIAGFRFEPFWSTQNTVEKPTLYAWDNPVYRQPPPNGSEDGLLWLDSMRGTVISY